MDPHRNSIGLEGGRIFKSDCFSSHSVLGLMRGMTMSKSLTKAIGWQNAVVNVFNRLREIRHAAARKEARRVKEQGGKPNSVDDIYMVPYGGLFKVILYPHYLCEWFEWAGFWLIGGATFVPGRSFLLAEMMTMTIRAVSGKKWYIDQFGKEKIGNRKAVIPGIL